MQYHSFILLSFSCSLFSLFFLSCYSFNPYSLVDGGFPQEVAPTESYGVALRNLHGKNPVDPMPFLNFTLLLSAKQLCINEGVSLRNKNVRGILRIHSNSIKFYKLKIHQGFFLFSYQANYANQKNAVNCNNNKYNLMYFTRHLPYLFVHCSIQIK